MPSDHETASREQRVEALAKVLADHEMDLGALLRDPKVDAGYWLVCKCGFKWTPVEPYTQQRNHLAEMLTNSPAMRDLLAEAKAEAWDEGFDEGSDDLFGRRTVNPYRTTEASDD